MHKEKSVSKWNATQQLIGANYWYMPTTWMSHKSITKWKKSAPKDYTLYVLIRSSRKYKMMVMTADQQLLGGQGLGIGFDCNGPNYLSSSGCTTTHICQNSSCTLKIGKFYCTQIAILLLAFRFIFTHFFVILLVT